MQAAPANRAQNVIAATVRKSEVEYHEAVGFACDVGGSLGRIELVIDGIAERDQRPLEPARQRAVVFNDQNAHGAGTRLGSRGGRALR